MLNIYCFFIKMSCRVKRLKKKIDEMMNNVKIIIKNNKEKLVKQ